MRTFLCLFILILFTSCAKNPQEKLAAAIDIALSHLSRYRCDDAIKVLLDSGATNESAVYVEVLASAYACKAQFDEVNFVEADLANHLDTTDASTIMRTLSTMSTSPETAADSVPYVGIRTGINTILNTTSAAPSQVDRDAKYGLRDSGGLGVQALILNFVNLGKFLNFYGNVDPVSGAKGAGSGSNKCFIKYNDNRAKLLITGGTTGACVSANDPHPNLDQSNATGKRRLCEGLMLITNALDILDNIDLSGNPDLAKLENVSAQVSTFRTAATAAGLGTLINMTSQSECETYLQTPANLDDMEYLYALIFESSLQ